MSIVLVTGASGGLGRELAVALGQQGHSIAIHYHSGQSRAEDVSVQIRSHGSKSLTHRADLRERDQVREMAEAVWKEWGRIDLWINNGAITVDRLSQALEEEDWDRVIAVNLNGAFFGIQEAARIMISQNRGHIINISSLVGQKGAIGQSAYSASKAGLIGLTKTAARELGPYNIQVNAVLPGYLPTPMTQDLPPKRIQSMIQENVMGRSSTFEEVSRFICHLAQMEHVSGQVFNLDSRIY